MKKFRGRLKVGEDSRQKTALPQISGRPSWQERLIPLIPALVAVVLFLPALGNGFVNWDDPAYVYQNLHIRHLELRWIFTGIVASNYHPLTLLSHTIDYALFGQDPMGHHLTSLILHGLNSALVFLLAKRLLTKGLGQGGTLGALIAALLFAVHPLHVESVVWVSERKDVLSAFFFLLSILFYLRYTEKGHLNKFYVLTLLAFIFALLSKPMAVTLPVVLLILDYYPLDRLCKGRAVIMEKIPFFAMSLASAIVTLWAQSTGGAVTRMVSYPLSIRILVAVRGYLFYSYKLLLPVGLAPYYPLPMGLGPSNPFFIVSLIFLAGVSLFCLFFAMRGKRALLAIWLYYLLTLAPVIGIIQVGSQAAADRYSYLPTIGCIMLGGALLSFLYKRLGGSKGIAVTITLLLLLLLSVKTTRTIPVWHDSVSLWSHEINFLETHNKKDRLAGTIAHYNRAKAYEGISLLPEAIADYTSVIVINPGYLDAYINRGVIYGRLGRFEEALPDFNRAVELDPSSASARYNRGLVYKNLGQMDKAREDFQAAMSLGQRAR